MITKKIKIQLKNGLEARPVAVLVQVASQYDSRIYVECENKKVNAKSIMGLMSLGLSAGEEVVVSMEMMRQMPWMKLRSTLVRHRHNGQTKHIIWVTQKAKC